MGTVATDSSFISPQEQKIQALFQEVEKVVVGQHKMIHRLLIGLFTNGHILLEGVPGLAKTLTINTLAKALQLDFTRIQFTPDLLPADLLGTMIYNQSSGKFEVKQGPIFSNLVLADEINRSPAKVQSALLEAMQEQQVSIGDHTYKLEEPFLVMATQNPIDQEGTYALPEAQVDRFMLKVFISYPNREDEKAIMRRMAKTQSKIEVRPILSKADIFNIRAQIDEIQLSEKLEDYIVDIIMATRSPKDYNMPRLQDYIEFGASPRASLALNLGSKAHAYLAGRDYVLPEDIKAIAPDVLNHRIILNYEAEAEEVTTMDCIDLILRNVEI
ncbi:MAG: MoxR family ATPase [Bacteroidota bacterium]